MFTENLMIALSLLAAIAMMTAAALKGWQGWLAFKARELDAQRGAPDQGHPAGMARIEIADLKERIRKLEAIAAGVDL
ncbi:MAG: hypothetical protein RL339_2718 [Pseudomonadota bacterium]|jgi:hypothetical protein